MIKHNKCLPHPTILQIEITNRCPFNCSQCYKGNSGNKDIPFALFQRIIDEAKRIGVRLIVLNGGEPLLYPNIFEAILLLNKLKIEHNIFTSGYKLSQNDLDNHFQSQYTNLFISVNGSNESINKLSRDGWKDTTSALEVVRNSNIHYSISWVARTDNVYDLPELIKLAKYYKAGFISIIGNKMINNHRMESRLTAKEYRYLSEYCLNYNVTRVSGDPILKIEQCFPELNIIMNSEKASCFAGKYGCAVNVDGKFMPCIHLNIKEEFDSIMQYWNNSAILQVLRTNEQPKQCIDCNYSKRCKICYAMHKCDEHGKLIEFDNCVIAKKL
jgi:MoaA/NifB/PqqE/SkfB family radical SAM enzyme